MLVPTGAHKRTVHVVYGIAQQQPRQNKGNSSHNRIHDGRNAFLDDQDVADLKVEDPRCGQNTDHGKGNGGASPQKQTRQDNDQRIGEKTRVADEPGHGANPNGDKEPHQRQEDNTDESQKTETGKNKEQPGYGQCTDGTQQGGPLGRAVGPIDR